MNERNQMLPPNLLIGRILVNDPDNGLNGQVSLRILPPMNKYYLKNETKINELNFTDSM